jgi:hypothetical protein
MTHRFRIRRPDIVLFTSLAAFSLGLPAGCYSLAAGPGRVWSDSLQGDSKVAPTSLLRSAGVLKWADSPQGAPETSPQIDHITPAQAAAGSEVTVEIDGRNFARGAYVSSSNPEVHVIKTRRVGPARIDAQLGIAPKAQPGAVTLYVTSPEGSIAQATFTIIGEAAPASPAPQSAVANGTTATTEEGSASPRGSPEVASVEPSSVTPGSLVGLKIKGKNFAPGAKVSFSNPGIRVLETTVQKSTELSARIQVAPEAMTGSGSLFVVNPDDSEVETPFQVIEGSPVTSGTAPEPSAPASAQTPAAARKKTASPSAGRVSVSQQFEVYSLGNVASILGSGDKSKGTLDVGRGTLKYLEAGKEVFSAAAPDIKEIGLNTILGVNTGTFHIILRSGKTYNFISASFRPEDGQFIVEALRKALQ